MKAHMPSQKLALSPAGEKSNKEQEEGTVMI